MKLEIKDRATGEVVTISQCPDRWWSSNKSSVSVPWFKRVLSRARGLRPDADLVHNVPVIDHLDAKILAKLKAGGKLNMNTWHVDHRPENWCGTAHCRAGWAEVIAYQETGTVLSLEPSEAGRLIYAVSRPGKTQPNFFCSDEIALKDLERCAAADPLPTDGV